MSDLQVNGMPSAANARLEAAWARTLTDKAHLSIKADVIDCVLTPGQLFSSQQLNNRYGAGMAAIRAAMERLVAGGWVESVPNKGYRIQPITVKDVVELYDLAEVISPRLARLSCGRIDAIHENLLQLNEVCFGPKAPMDEKEEHVVLGAAGEILRQVRLASGNTYATVFTQQMTERLDRVVAARRQFSAAPIDFRRDFRPLIEALYRNDRDGAEKASLINVLQMKTLILNKILQTPSIAHSAIHFPA